MSAAGQMTSFLGIVGKRAIFQDVVKCWASLKFVLKAINYWRQMLDSPMATVIQGMGRAHCAGVMFTCDPVTSRPAHVIVTVKFGLGKSVVSAAVDPDIYAPH